MGKTIYLVNAIFGLAFGALVIIGPGIFGILMKGFNVISLGAITGGLIGMAFGWYQLKKFRET